MSKKKAMFFKQSGGGGEPIDYALDFMTATTIPNDSTVYYGATAQEITGAGLWTAIDDLVINIGDTIMDKMYAIYPHVGVLYADSAKWNLKNPLDTDEAFRLTFDNTGHDKLGSKLVNWTIDFGFMDTHFSPANNGVLTDLSFGYYNTEAGDIPTNEYWSGCRDAQGEMFIRSEYGGDITGKIGGTAVPSYVYNAGELGGLWSASRTSSTDSRIFYKGVEKAINTSVSTSNLPVTNFYLRCINEWKCFR